MAEPTKEPCPICADAGIVYVNEFDVASCSCQTAKIFKRHLGPEIASADTILNSPLFFVEEDEVKLDRSTENLLIKAPWRDLLSHLKWMLYCKGMRYRFRIVTDEKIRTVFVGNERYGARPKSTREDVQTYNSLGDLVGADFDLIIIQIGKLGYKNIAAPGALKEALMLRETACLPTWISETPDSPWGYGCQSYSDDVGDYIERHYEIVSLTPSARPAAPRHVVPEQDEVSGTEDPNEMTPPAAAEPQEPVRSRFTTPAAALDELDGVVSGPDKWKPKKKKDWGKKSGGGPV